jgi:5-methylcytosine-specific restriction endonuclease McrA
MAKQQKLQKRQKTININKHPVLVLNKAYMPIDVYEWGDAICDWFCNRAEIVDEYTDVKLRGGMDAITGHQFSMNCPSVIRKTGADGEGGRFVNFLPLTRTNILDRDKYLCAYCGCKLTLSTMTLDHVYPESKGGLSDWTNLRAACSRCNGEKGDKTLSELGWKLRSRVGIPTITKGAPKNIVTKIGGKIADESWRKYIYWSVETTEKIRDI